MLRVIEFSGLNTATFGIVCALAITAAASRLHAQVPALDPRTESTQSVDEAPSRVEVGAQAEDREISERLQNILAATAWFEGAKVRTREGVVFLQGVAQTEQRKKWATELARNTVDVVAVVNQMNVREIPLWSFEPALRSLRALLRSIVLALPAAGFALFVLIGTYLLSRIARLALDVLLKSRVQTPLLRRLLARTGATLVFLLGVYVVLHVSGLTRLAVSVLGGTGVLGLILGIAFRDISENFLASIFLSIQQPFKIDDLVEVAGTTGYIQRATYRVTVIVTLDGQQVQVPNSTVYKSVIRNFTSIPNRREEFQIGIGFDAPISHAQEVAYDVLKKHPAVLSDPEPWVLVDSLGSATVNLRIYFWLDGTRHSWLKVRSSVIRLTKRAFQDANVSMPDEAREVVFPRGVPLRMMESQVAVTQAEADQASPCPEESPDSVSRAEGELRSDADELKEQSRQGRPVEDGGENLLSGGSK